MSWTTPLWSNKAWLLATSKARKKEVQKNKALVVMTMMTRVKTRSEAKEAAKAASGDLTALEDDGLLITSDRHKHEWHTSSSGGLSKVCEGC